MTQNTCAAESAAMPLAPTGVDFTDYSRLVIISRAAWGIKAMNDYKEFLIRTGPRHIKGETEPERERMGRGVQGGTCV